MAVTHDGILTNSIATAYDREYLYNFVMKRVWFDFIDWQTPIGGSLRGSTITQPVMEALAANTTALDDNVEHTPVVMADDSVDMTIYERGNAVQTTRFLKIVSFTTTEKAAAKVVGENQAKSLDLVIRAAAVAGTLVQYPLAVVSRVTLAVDTDIMTYLFATELVARAASMGIPPFEDGSYAAIVHPTLLKDVQNTAEWKAVGEYSDPKLIYTGRPGQIYGGYKFKGEAGALGGLRFISHPLGKIFLGAGVADQATDVADANAVSAGATTVNVTAAGTLAIGDWLTIGRGLATEEQVLITGVATNALTVRGLGNVFSNFGCKYAHAVDEICENPGNIGAVPVFGPNSIRGRFASEVGKNGEARVGLRNTVIPGRFINHSWYWVGGFAVMQKYLLRGEVAVSGGIYGDNK